jgi:nitrite reductase (NADH) small subunit
MKNNWILAGSADDFSINMGSCVKHEDEQIAVFNINHKKWYAVQNRCPHEKVMVLSRGILGDSKREPFVACPLHKRRFSLKTGLYHGYGECERLQTYAVKKRDGKIFIKMKE